MVIMTRIIRTGIMTESSDGRAAAAARPHPSHTVSPDRRPGSRHGIRVIDAGPASGRPDADASGPASAAARHPSHSESLDRSRPGPSDGGTAPPAHWHSVNGAPRARACGTALGLRRAECHELSPKHGRQRRAGRAACPSLSDGEPGHRDCHGTVTRHLGWPTLRLAALAADPGPGPESRHWRQARGRARSHESP